jgi:hypothetical protein
MTRASIPTTTDQNRNVTRSDYGLIKFSKWRIDRARGDPAAHGPLLLLLLRDFVEKEGLSDGVLPLSPERAFRFYAYGGPDGVRPLSVRPLL